MIAAECSAMVGGQRLAEPGPSHVKRVAELLQGVAEASRRGMLLVQNDQNRLLHVSDESQTFGRIPL